MKYRSDFVTNSSSSSFIICYKSPEDMVKAVQKFVKNYEDDEYSNQFRTVVYDIFKRKVTYTEVIDMITKHARYEARVKYQCDVNGVAKYGSYDAWRGSKEYASICKAFVDKEVEKFRRKFTSNNYFALLEYDDADGFFDVNAELEKMLNGVIFKSKD